MEFVLIIFTGFILGALAAMPVGPVQIEVIKRAISGHLRSSLMVILGAMASDAFYGFIALFGIAPFLKQQKTMVIFYLAGAIIMTIIGIITIRQSLLYNSLYTESRYLKKKRWAFLSGLSISATNPMMILWWLIGAHLLIEFHIIRNFNTNTSLSFIMGGSSGLAAYLFILSLALFWAKRFISEKKIRIANIVFGCLLLFIAAYFAYTSLNNIFK
jgi:threonine/homoserine/homoserine lactone efflux protein